MSIRPLLLLALLTACAGEKDGDTQPLLDDTGEPAVDNDGDGVPADADCDDNDRYTYPGAPEVPYDGKDQDCDGEDINDVDGDGYIGDGAGGDDCNDSNPDVHPDATVVCYDLIDEDCTEGWSQYDCDGDGYEVGIGGDCEDEGHPEIHPGAEDTWYDGIDSDCDGRDDYDQDEDGEQSSDYGGTDCDDLDATINTEADETWDGLDNDCANGADILTSRNTYGSWYGDNSLTESLFAWDYAPVGDLDGDGLVDVVVGVLGYSEYTGRAYVLPSGEGLQVPATSALATIDGEAASFTGSGVGAVAGPDGTLVAVGAAAAATVYLYDVADLTGGVTLGSGDAVAAITSSAYYIPGGLDPWDDGDGGQALLVHSFEVEDGGAYVGLYPGAALSGTLTADDALWSWEASGDMYDASVLTDFDGDGLPEIGIATSGFGGSTRAYVASGALVSEGGADTATSALSGFTGHLLLAGTNDLDGDGYGEYAISDWEADGSADAGGKIWLVSGPDALVGGAVADLAFATVSGISDGGALRSGSASGDLDGDGGQDLVTCAPGTGTTNVKGSCSWLSGVVLAAGGDFAPGTTGPTFSSVAYDDEYGHDALPQDIDGDGDDDLWIAGTGDAGFLVQYIRE